MTKLKKPYAYNAYKKSRDAKHIQTQTGMALLEVLVAMLIFALAILPLVRLQVMSMDATKAGYYRTEAVSVAQSIMDYLVNDPQEIFNKDPAGFREITVVAGENCGNDDDLKGILCNIVNAKVNTQNAHLFPAGNAVFCLERDNAPTNANSQVEISVKAVWYIGKRSSDGNNLNQDLNASFCQGNWANEVPYNLRKENIDFIDIHMTY